MNQNEINEKITNAVIANLEKCGSWRKLWSTVSKLDFNNPSTGTKYSFCNNIYLLEQLAYRNIDEDAIDKTFMTFAQISKIGAKVNKGAKAYAIFLYLPAYYDKKAKKYLQPKDYAKLTQEEKKEIQVFPTLRTYNVFNTIDVTFKSEADQQKYSFKGNAGSSHDTKTNDEIEKIFINYYKKENIKIHENTSSNQAFYRPATHEIVIPKISQYEKQSHFYQVKSHETIHSTGKTLKREVANKKGDSKYSFEELVAELGSMMLLENFGMLDEDIQDNSTSYIKGWSEFLRDNVGAILKASTQAQKAAEYVLAE